MPLFTILSLPPYYYFLFFSSAFPAVDVGEAVCLQWRCCLPIKGNSGKTGSILLSFQFRLPNFFPVFSGETFTGTIWLICTKFNTHRAYWSYCTCTDHLCGMYAVCLRPWTPWLSCKVHVHMNNEHYSEIPGGLAAHSDSLLWLCCPIFLEGPSLRCKCTFAALCGNSLSCLLVIPVKPYRVQ